MFLQCLPSKTKKEEKHIGKGETLLGQEITLSPICTHISLKKKILMLTFIKWNVKIMEKEESANKKSIEQ